MHDLIAEIRRLLDDLEHAQEMLDRDKDPSDGTLLAPISIAQQIGHLASVLEDMVLDPGE